MGFQAVYVSEELSRPEKQLPLAINSALSITIVSFLVANAAFYVLLPWQVIATTDSVAVVSRLVQTSRSCSDRLV
jgi:L-asparagine transporter-like permease